MIRGGCAPSQRRPGRSLKRHATASGWRWARRGADSAIDVWRERERRRRRQQRARGRQRPLAKDQTANRRPSSIETTGCCSRVCVVRQGRTTRSCRARECGPGGAGREFLCSQGIAIARAISAADGNSSAMERGRRVAASVEGLVQTPSACKSRSGIEGACGTSRGTGGMATAACRHDAREERQAV